MTRSSFIRILLTGLLTSFIRHNGYYTVLPTLILFCFYFKGKSRKYIIACALSTLIIFKLFSTYVFTALGFAPISSQSYLSIPFQMTARYVVTYENEITSEEHDAISSVLDYDRISTDYNPVLSDPMNRLYTENDSAIPQYINIWFKMLRKHPVIYLSAFINNNYGYIAPVYSQLGMYFNYGESEVESSYGIKHIFSEFPIKLFDSIKESAEHFPVLRYFSMAGTYTWILLVLIIILLYNKKYKHILLFVPGVLTIVFCLLSPCTFELRYMLPNISTLHLLISIVILALGPGTE